MTGVLGNLTAWVLNTYLGEYIEDFDASHLTIGLLRGQVELENLPLKKSAFQKLDLPIEVKSGIIGHATLRIPVSQLRSQPWIIHLDELYVVLGASDESMYTEENVLKSLNEWKLNRLKLLEDKWRESQGKKQNATWWWSYGTSVASNILENVQMDLSRVHIRFEDNGKLVGKPFTFGIKFDSLSAKSVDNDWVPKFINRSETEIMRKLLDIKNFAIYWDFEVNRMYGDCQSLDLINLFKEFSEMSHEYILPPLSMEARMHRNTQVEALKSANMPRIAFDIVMSNLPINLNSRQFAQFIRLTKELEKIRIRQKYFKWRPKCHVSGHTTEWWKFAIKCHQDVIYQKRKVFTLTFLLERSRMLVNYVKAYEKKWINEYIDIVHSSYLNNAEEQLTFEQLKCLREIALKRAEKVKAAQEEVKAIDSSKEKEQITWGGYFASWYSGKKEEIKQEKIPEKIVGAINEKELEEFIDSMKESIDNDTLLKRDIIFAKFSFQLHKVQLCLSETKSVMNDALVKSLEHPLVEFSCQNVSFEFEWRPRTSSYKLNMIIQSINVIDTSNKNNFLPCLLAPQLKDTNCYRSILSTLYKSKSATPSPMNIYNTEEKFFELTFEKKQPKSSADYCFELKTKPLDIVYNAKIVQKIRQFFSIRRSSTSNETQEEAVLTAIAKRKLEELKKQTTEGLQEKLDELIEGSESLSSKRWYVNLDIAAPQIIIPDSDIEEIVTFVVVGLGRLQFHNVAAGLFRPESSSIIPSENDVSDDDDEFVTPSSTPPSEPAIIRPSLSDLRADTSITRQALQDKIYEKYVLTLSNAHVMVGTAKDNWRSSSISSSSLLHCVDRFDISLKVERRLIRSDDPEWPNLTLIGIIPSLQLHMSENKVKAIKNCITFFSTNGNSQSTKLKQHDIISSKQSGMYQSVYSLYSKSVLNVSNVNTSIDDRKPSFAESRLILIQFEVDKVSLEIHSKELPLAELQIRSVRANFTKRPYDLSTCLTVHSLLIADAMQKYGSDFDLLVASHKNLCLDSCSGNIRDSDPNSPLSPKSPSSPCESDSLSRSTSSFSNIHRQFMSALQNVTGTFGDNSNQTNTSGKRIRSPPILRDEEALICIEIQITQGSPNEVITEPTIFVDVQLCSLDFIFNQETLIELLNFYKIVNPISNLPSDLQDNLTSIDRVANTNNYTIELIADLSRLNLLLMRGQNTNDKGLKVATVAVNGARVTAIKSSTGCMKINGFLECMQVMSLLEENQQRIIGVGGNEQYTNKLLNNSEKACEFEMIKENDFAPLKVNLHLASVCYVHNPIIFQQIPLCLDNFQEHVTSLAKELRNRAKDFALDMVKPQTKSNFSVDVILETPFIILPKQFNSKNVLVAQLGNILLKHGSNNLLSSTRLDNSIINTENQESNLLVVDLKEMQMFAVNIEPNRLLSIDINNLTKYCNSGLKILHETNLEFNVDRQKCLNFDDSLLFAFDTEKNDCQEIAIGGKIVTPIRMTLNKSAFEQIIATLDNLTPPSNNGDVKFNSNLENLDGESFDSTSTLVPDKNSFSIKATFNLPIFQVTLNFEQRGGVQVELHDFTFVLTKHDNYSKNVDLKLQRLLVKDLSEPDDSKHKYLMVSTAVSDENNEETSTEFLSSSCPTSMIDIESSFIPSSLPGSFSNDPVFKTSSASKLIRKRCKSHSFCPGTPPPSPAESNDAFVHINVTFIEKSSPLFDKKYNSMNRLIKVEFNTLDTTINLQCWVVLLDFLGLGAKVRNPDDFRQISSLNRSSSTIVEKPVNTQVEIYVNSFSLILNKETYELARAKISNLTSKLCMTNHNLSMSGTLGSITLKDSSPYGCLYDHKFSFIGHQAMAFNIFKYGLPDPDLLKPFDIEVSLEMSSVRYVHTQRFIKELIAFFQNFNQLQDILGRMRASSAGEKISEKAFRGSRIKLKIDAGSPIIVMPMSWISNELIVADLGKLSIRNQFLFENEEGTLGFSPLSQENAKMEASIYGSLDADLRNHKCLLDIWTVKLKEMDVYEAIRTDDRHVSGVIEFIGFNIERKEKFLKETCELDLQIERNLEGDISHSVPDFGIKGILSSVDLSLGLDQFKLVKGFLEFNLGESVEEFKEEIMSHLIDPKIHTVISGNVWKSLSFTLKLNNVSIELKRNNINLAKIDFICSNLSFESFSNGAKDIDLVSNAIVVYDLRNKENVEKSNVFVEILKPVNVNENDSNNTKLQMEIHFHKLNDLTRFTVLLNNMKLMGIFDWMFDMSEYLLTNPVKPSHESYLSKINTSSSNTENNLSINQKNSSLKSISGTVGILTKRVNSEPNESSTLEFKLNVRNTELILVENAKLLDSNAVILKSTAVLIYKKSSLDSQITCNLQSLEVFSCCLANENDTALSIVDPTSISFELATDNLPHRQDSMPGLEEATHELSGPVLKATLSTIDIRLSYNDWKLFLAIIKSLPKQSQDLNSVSENNLNTTNQTATLLNENEHLISKLQELGYERTKCINALKETNYNFERAKSILSSKINVDKNNDGLQITSYEIKANRISLCLIDDCLDTDVPLVEFIATNVHFFQNGRNYASDVTGRASVKLALDLYNRTLSGWEPVLEVWNCKTNWTTHAQIAAQKELNVKILSDDVLNVNITKTLLTAYEDTKNKWMSDFYDENSMATVPKRRIPFVPFTIYNKTGVNLQFAILIFKANEIDKPEVELGDWVIVNNNEKVNFRFKEREKTRHKHTHELKMQQIIVKVEGWKETSALSVDKVGIFFRDVITDNDCSSIFFEHKNARFVFDISLEGTAKKIITVRSSLVLYNQLSSTIEIKLCTTSQLRDEVFVIEKNDKLAIPIPHVLSRIYVRPYHFGVEYCSKDLFWTQVTKSRQIENYTRTCNVPADRSENYFRFCVSVYREPFPEDFKQTAKTSTGGTKMSYNTVPQPGHQLTICSPMSFQNLLPIDIQLRINNNKETNLAAGKMVHFYNIDIEKELNLTLLMENFKQCKPLQIQKSDWSSPCNTYKIFFDDCKNRNLQLFLEMRQGLGGSLRIVLFSQFWILNKTGLPLLYRQAECEHVAAGQFDEHETARYVMPFMFSFADSEATEALVIRLGKSVHHNSKPMFCNKIHLINGVARRKLPVSPNDSRKPEFIYDIGIEVCSGKGVYSHSKIITLMPSFHFENRTQFRLSFVQEYYALGKGAEKVENELEASPGCNMAFHWPRFDFDQLLCVRRTDINDCNWSGGFRIDKVNSFHVNMRNKLGNCLFLRVDVVLERATYYAVFTDAQNMPPPYRIDNFSEVSIQYYQTKVVEEKLRRAFIKPNTQVPYAWDKPSLPHHITLSVSGGSSSTYNLDVLKDGDKLFYSNYIYIGFQETFGSSANQEDGCEDLVLDVPEEEGGRRVFIKKKEIGKRSQLWQMTTDSCLIHEGSMPPNDPSNSSSRSKSNKDIYVLDIDDIGINPNKDTPLVVRKLNDKRRGTQRWKCTMSTLQLLMDHGISRFVVQCKGGENCLFDGNQAVVSCVSLSLICNKTIPDYQHIKFQKVRPGSGLLSVRVTTDGPTRVLEITDVRYSGSAVESSVDSLENTDSVSSTESLLSNNSAQLSSDVTIILTAGIGLSIINHVPEELLYIHFQDINMHFKNTNDNETDLDASIYDIEASNQLFNCINRRVLQVPYKRSDKKTLALSVKVTKLNSKRWTVEVFKHIEVELKTIALKLEEVLLWKLIQFFMDLSISNDQVDDDYKATVADKWVATSADNLKRFYIGFLKINISKIILSMKTRPELPDDLKAIKKKIGIPLLNFEEANVDLDEFVNSHIFDTKQLLNDTILFHYRQEFRGQLAKILGSVNFLGNPAGLINDVTDGITSLIDGNLPGLFANVAHGVSDSTAKVMGSVSDVVSFGFDNQHEQKRREIREKATTSSDSLYAGFKGLKHGFWGGIKGVVSQPISGYKDDKFTGVVKGIGVGMYGLFAKPVTGMLDFASSSANAVRELAAYKDSNNDSPKMRLPRCCFGKAGLLPQYNEKQAIGQQVLFSINGYQYDEKCLDLIPLITCKVLDKNGLNALISNKQTIIVSNTNVVTTNAKYENLLDCRKIENDGKFYLQFTLKNENGDSLETANYKRPWYLCESEQLALTVAEQINYARNLFNEAQLTLNLNDELI